MDEDGKPDIVSHVPIEYADHESDGLREHGNMGFSQGERAIHSSASLNVQVHKEQQIILIMVIKDGSHLVLASGKKHRWLIKVKRGTQFHTHHGIIEHDALIGMEFGDIYHAPRTRKGFVLIQPTIHELATRVSRKTQVI
ncbi:hypothetical protein GF325_08385, partial [Candidatus Bathyarchaeota archaeon]|nr:hypothetical protein [Candidatus Bathyarchaeota archaeon]